MLRDKFKEAVVVVQNKDFASEMAKVCKKLKPQTCLECVAGDTTGQMLEFMGFKSTLILYGLLSDKPAGGINTIAFIGKAQTIESFLLMNYLGGKSKEEYTDMIKRASSLYPSILSTEVNAQYGLHQIEEAIQYYLKNQTAGKVVIKPSLTPTG